MYQRREKGPEVLASLHTLREAQQKSRWEKEQEGANLFFFFFFFFFQSILKSEHPHPTRHPAVAKVMPEIGPHKGEGLRKESGYR
jgi:hypothetical protein